MPRAVQRCACLILLLLLTSAVGDLIIHKFARILHWYDDLLSRSVGILLPDTPTARSCLDKHGIGCWHTIKLVIDYPGKLAFRLRKGYAICAGDAAHPAVQPADYPVALQ
jgi:hypothetical protein